MPGDSSTYRYKRVLSAPILRLLGRRNSVRFARFLLNEARLDVPNHPKLNGEVLLQRWVLDNALPAGERLVAFDVGANHGDWTCSLLSEIDRRRGLMMAAAIHSFEPVSSTYGMLCARVRQCRADVETTLINKAVSDHSGSSDVFVPGPGAGTSSLHEGLDAVTDGTSTAARERVSLITIDEYCKETGITSITLLKCDAEGHDMAVIRGAGEMLENQRIGVLQFEYNWRWVFSRSYLKDVFDLSSSANYAIGKVTPLGIEFYSRWNPELENFVEANYVAVRQDWAQRLPRVRWWNDVAS